MSESGDVCSVVCVGDTSDMFGRVYDGEALRFVLLHYNRITICICVIHFCVRLCVCVRVCTCVCVILMVLTCFSFFCMFAYTYSYDKIIESNCSVSGLCLCSCM